MKRERGAVLVVVAASLMLLFGVGALVVDLSAVGLDRATDQRVTDAAASAGALALFEGSAVEGCEAALAYLAINSLEIPPLTGDCAIVFGGSCPAMERVLPFSSGRFAIDIVHPVPDGHELMTSGIIGASSQPLAADDGDPCERIGVRIRSVHSSFLAQVIGFDETDTSVHTVARAELPPPDGVPINVLVLDRFGCGVVKASGHGGIIVDAIYNPDDDVLEPGTLAADSDAANCGADPDPAVIIVEGNNATIRADGPVCPDNIGTEPFHGLTKGLGCGLIQTLAPGTPGCNIPACAGSGSGPNNPVPEPTALTRRLTRSPIDYRFNCRSDYTTVPVSVAWAASPLTPGNEQDIPGCPGPGSNYVHQLIAGVGQSGTPSSFAPWNLWSPTYPCDIPSSHAAISESGNWFINCPEFNVRVDVSITGNVVFQGDVAVTSSTGHLTIDNSGSADTFTFAFMRDGLFRKDGHASITLDETTVYLSKTSWLQMEGGGTGHLVWIAPDDPSKPLDDLALWSDSEVTAATHSWAGQAALTMEGVFFVPIVTVEYAGQGSQQQTSAQFIADRLHARGQGELIVAPVFGRSVGFQPPPYTILLR
jgi:hypothetical protein